MRKFVIVCLLLLIAIGYTTVKAQLDPPTFYSRVQTELLANRDRVENQCLEPIRGPYLYTWWKTTELIDKWNNNKIVQVPAPNQPNGILWVGCNPACGPAYTKISFNSVACTLYP